MDLTSRDEADYTRLSQDWQNEQQGRQWPAGPQRSREYHNRDSHSQGDLDTATRRCFPSRTEHRGESVRQQAHRAYGRGVSLRPRKRIIN
jgi:hypothetical protein